MPSSPVIGVDCQHCLKSFEAADSLAGGITNCPGCGKATPVPGLRDPLFRVMQVAMLGGWAVLTAIGWVYGGALAALVLAVGGALVLGLLYISM